MGGFRQVFEGLPKALRNAMFKVPRCTSAEPPASAIIALRESVPFVRGHPKILGLSR